MFFLLSGDLGTSMFSVLFSLINRWGEKKGEGMKPCMDNHNNIRMSSSPLPFDVVPI